MDFSNFRIKNIEFLRIIACLAIVWGHLMCGFNALLPDSNLIKHLFRPEAGIAVELFFIISGLLFGLKFSPLITWTEFLKKKFIRLYPVAVFVIFTGFLISLTGFFDFNLYQGILNILGLLGTGLISNKASLDWQIAGQFWYVSSMMWSLIFYFYILKNFDKKIADIIIALTCYFSYSLVVTAGDMSPTLKICGAFNIGLLRGLGGIGLGYFIGEFYKVFGEKTAAAKFNLKQTLSVSIIEFMCLFFTINNLFLHKIKFNNMIIFVIVFSILTALFIFKKGIFSNMLDISFWSKLSKYTYSIYMVHCLCLVTIQVFLFKYHMDFIMSHLILCIVLSIIICLLAGILIYYFVEVPAKKYFSYERNKS